MQIGSLVVAVAVGIVIGACSSADGGSTSGSGAPPTVVNGSGPGNGGGDTGSGPPPQPGAGPTGDDAGPGARDGGTPPAHAGDGGAGADADAPAGDMTAAQKHKAEMLTSIWENSTTVLQYPYCQNIGDGRGYTSGRAGFCSGTGDAIQVVDCFDKAFGTGANNPMAKYMPALTKINDAFTSTGNSQADTSPLDAVGTYCGDWAKTTNDAATSGGFRACQDQIVDLLYYRPGLAHAKTWGLVTALTKAELYDAEINHGDDGTAALIKQANADVGNTAQTPAAAPLALADESKWLHAFLLRRLALLKSDKTWAQSEDRVVTYEALRQAGNFDLSAKIETNAKAITMYPGQGYQDSGYPDCVIAPDGTASGDAACTSPTGG